MDEIRAHLPEEPNTFVGRERELVELHQLLHRTRALTLCGPGGIGKTRLALRLLASAAAEFPDGIWFVELADLPQHDLQQADLVVSRIASVIGITEEAGRPLLETLGDALRSRRLLLALDNCEHLLDACAQVGRHLLASAPGLRLLATSREPLSVAAETIWRVPPMSVPGGYGGAGSPPVSGGIWGGSFPPRPAQPPSATKRSGCSPTGPRPPSPASPSGRTTSRPSPRSAARWTGCRWRSSWPRPGSGRCRWSRSRAGWTTGSAC